MSTFTFNSEPSIENIINDRNLSLNKDILLSDNEVSSKKYDQGIQKLLYRHCPLPVAPPVMMTLPSTIQPLLHMENHLNPHPLIIL